MKNTNIIKLIHADDHEFFRTGFRKIFESQQFPDMSIIGEADNGVSLIRQIEVLHPDIVLTDLKMPVMDGMEAAKRIISLFSSIKVIAFSAFENTQEVLDFIRTGARGYILKHSTIDQVADAIRQVSEGHLYLSPDLTETMHVSNGKSRDKKILFNAQELNVMKMICLQHTTKEISASLHLSTRTVEDYRHHLQEKIGARNMVGIALYALINEYIDPDELADI